MLRTNFISLPVTNSADGGRRSYPKLSKCNKMLSYRRETALQGTLVLAESGRLELRENILLIL